MSCFERIPQEVRDEDGFDEVTWLALVTGQSREQAAAHLEEHRREDEQRRRGPVSELLEKVMNGEDDTLMPEIEQAAVPAAWSGPGWGPPPAQLPAAPRVVPRPSDVFGRADRVRQFIEARERGER